MPGPHGWNVLRSVDLNGSWDVQMVANLEEAVPHLRAGDKLVLGLPLTAILAQRFHLPTVEPSEFPEMVRIQIEKALPFSADEVTTDFEVIEQNENGSVVSAIAVRNEQLAQLAAPLLDRGYIPTQVTVYASQRATTHQPEGRALLIYPEGEQLVSAVTENGKVSLTRTLDGIEPEQLQSGLPQLTLSAELQGISGVFPNVFLDETCFELRDTVENILTSRPELVGVETPPATVKLNLLPQSWRDRRAALARRGEWQKRLMWAGGVYAGILYWRCSIWVSPDFRSAGWIGRLARTLRRSSLCAQPKRTGSRSLPRSIVDITRSRSCYIYMRAFRLRTSGSLLTINPLARFRWMGRRTQRPWLISSPIS